MERTTALTTSQRDLYLDWSLRESKHLYNLGFCLPLGEGVERKLWEEAVRWVLDHDDIARTRIIARKGRISQGVDFTASPHFEYADLAGGAAPGQTPREYLRQRTLGPLDLHRAPLFRNYLVKDGAGRFTAGLVASHLVFDALSSKLYFERVSAAYEALREGRIPEPTRVPSFYDYVENGSPVFDSPETLEYWHDKCAHVEALEFQRSANRAAPNTCARVLLAAGDAAAIKKYCVANGFPLPAFFQTVYAYLLQRYANRENDFVVHSLAGFRPREYVRTLGCFFQVLPVIFSRDSFADEASVAACARQVARYARALAPHENVSVFAMSRILGDHPVKCFFNYQPFAGIRILGRSETCRYIWFHPEDEIHLSVIDAGPAVELELSCNPKSMLEAGFLGRVLDVSRQVCAGTSLWKGLDIVLDDEREEAAGEGPAPRTGPSSLMDAEDRWLAASEESWPLGEETLLSGFQRQVRESPAAAAVIVDGGETLSYRQLDERSNQLGRWLRERGVCGDAVVGVLAERSAGMMTAIYGVLKAGGAYLPLEPEWPAERVRQLLADSRAEVVVFESRLAERLGDWPGRRLRIDEDWPAEITTLPTGPLTAVAGPTNLAYVIYTSGSTGRPKGVGIEHAGIVNRLRWMQAAYRLAAGERVLQKTPISFDVSVWELFWPLATGATLVMARPGGHRDAAYLADAVRRHQVSTLHFVPTMLTVFLREESLSQCQSLRRVVASGEALSYELVEQFYRRLPQATLYNLYGPTEASVDVTHWTCAAGDPRRTVPIGRPIANMRTYVLGPRLEPLPVGVAGELYLAGVGLARGYLHHPELTAAAFVHDPFSTVGGTRMYKTGDLARWLPDGTLEYLGRLDAQVKIRGQRIEPAEIEAAIGLHPEVLEAAVAARQDPQADAPGCMVLAAYLVPRRPGATLAADRLSAWLAQRLPAGWVPSSFTTLAALPRTTSGKVDRQKLPAPDTSHLVLETPYVAPRGPVEAVLAKVWREVLGVGQVGIHDNFFELGGHSLAATTLVARVYEELKADVPLSLIFSHPTVAEVASALEGALSRGEGMAGPELKPLPRGGPMPCSFSQERIWFVQQMAPENRAYEFLSTLRFTGPLDVSILEKALSEVVRRHEIYRTTFTIMAGQPYQVIHEPWQVRLTVTDLRRHAGPGRAAEEARLVREATRDGFRLERLPLVRWSLLRTGDEEYILIHFEHHIVHDGWSFIVLLKELLILYRAFAEGRPSPLPELEIQFADFAAWQRKWMEGPVRASQLAYWKETLQGAPAVLDLPTDHPRPPVQTSRGSALRCDLPADLSAAISRGARDGGVTVYMTLLAAFLAALHRHTGQDDIVVGSGVANRRWRQTESMLGMIINNLVLRCNLSGDPSFRELVRRVREVCVGAMDHQDVPFDAVVEELNPPRSPSYSPLFQAIFTSYDGEIPELELPGIHIELNEALSLGTAKFDLNVIAISRKKARAGAEPGGAPETLSLIWEYNSDLFEETSMRRMLEQYLLILRAAVANPAQRISELPILVEEEKAKVLGEWSKAQSDYPRHQCIHEVFEDVVRQRPDATALCHGETLLTYRELNERANRVAYTLRSLGVRPGTLVGLRLERSPEMIAATLAILKAGGAYVPLDPAYPQRRLAYMLNDTQVPVLVTKESLLETLPDYGGRILCLDRDQDLLRAAPADNPVNCAGPDDLAYVMYTSGSTGSPKGVCVLHRGVVRLVKNANYIDLSADDTMLQTATISFDAATFEIWGALLNGARLVLFPGDRYSLGELGDVVQRYGVTVMLLISPVFHQMVDDHLEGLRGVRQLVVGGDVLSAEHVKRALEGLDGATVINAYGPTEGTVIACACPVRGPGVGVPALAGKCRLKAELQPLIGDSVPIGRPVSNTRVFILDPYRRPVPVGVAGELYIGGDGLARGYLNAPELTAERFVGPLPGLETAGRLYRTGDRARYRPDGAIEFLGRLDRQVKVRGFRIEPGEVEAALNSHPSVLRAAVVARDGPGGSRRLDAYAVVCDGVEVSDLRAFLRERLPDYMLPTGLAIVKEIPLTASGKIDREALPEPPRAGPAPAAPRTPAEDLLARIWAELLELETVGIHENFFDLGGHSLLATRIASRVHAELGADLPLQAVFASPTIAELAAVVDGLEQDGPSQRAAPLVPVSRTARRRTKGVL